MVPRGLLILFLKKKSNIINFVDPLIYIEPQLSFSANYPS